MKNIQPGDIVRLTYGVPNTPGCVITIKKVVKEYTGEIAELPIYNIERLSDIYTIEIIEHVNT